jgi:serine/threonine protein phosphatase PrpC
VEIQEIAQHIHWHGLEKGIKLLIDLANQRGGDDNVTVVACQFTE